MKIEDYKRRVQKGLIFEPEHAYYVLNDRGSAKIVFDDYGLAVLHDTNAVRVHIMGHGKYTIDEHAPYAYVRKELEQLATVFNSNADLRTWLHTVFHTRIVRDGKRYVARMAPHDLGCQMCAFYRHNVCIPCVRIAEEQGLSHLAASVYYVEY